MVRPMTPLLLLLATFPIFSVADNPGDKGRFLATVNQERQKFASENHVSNMYRLVWSQELVDVVQRMDMEKRELPPAETQWSYALITDFESIAERINEKKEEFEEYGTFLNRDLHDASELLNPEQKVIGCSTSTNGEKRVLCLLGPKTEFSSFLFDPNVTDPCSIHYHFEDNLCVPNNELKVSLFGFRWVFLPELNNYRRQYAIDHQILNMHSIVWDENLVNAASLKKYDNELLNDGDIQWRMTKLPSYRQVSEQIEQARREFNNLNYNEKMDQFTQKQSRGGLELLEPLQTSIGCSPLWEAEKVFLVCLLGPQGISAKPGSNCMEGYKNVGGLCSR